eukprot:750733-Hanusia_phi.AAC.19
MRFSFPYALLSPALHAMQVLSSYPLSSSLLLSLISPLSPLPFPAIAPHGITGQETDHPAIIHCARGPVRWAGRIRLKPGRRSYVRPVQVDPAVAQLRLDTMIPTRRVRSPGRSE